MKELQKLLSKTRRACEHYGMIAEGDKIAVGLSGGKDSIALLCALNAMKRFYPVHFEVCGVSIDNSFPDSEGLFDAIGEYCSSEGIEYSIVKTQIYDIVFRERKEKNPCSLCAMMRRGALINEAKRIGANSVALGHHMDDAVETFMMSLLNEGRISCFWPLTDYEDNGVKVIRPLIYAREYEVAAVTRVLGLPVSKSPCSEDGHTDREKIGRLMKILGEDNRDLYRKILGAMEKGKIDGWF